MTEETLNQNQSFNIAVDGPVIYGSIQDDLEATSEIGRRQPKVGFADDENPLDNSKTHLKKKAFSQLLADALDDLDEDAKSSKKKKRSKTKASAKNDPLEIGSGRRHSV